MRICILTVGTRGDVQPCVALGVGLKAAGYEVRLASYAVYESFVRKHGLDFSSIAGHPEIWYTSYSNSPAPTLIDSFDLAWRTARLFRSQLPAQIESTWQACQDADAIITMPLELTGYHIAEKLKIPVFITWTNPIAPTQDFPSSCFPSKLLPGKAGNLLTHLLAGLFYWQPIAPIINRWRQHTLGLDAIPFYDLNYLYRQRIPLLNSISPTAFPKPADWGDWIHLTGFFFLETSPDWQPSRKVTNFLAAGSPPVYVGFGSAITEDAEAFTDLIIQALMRTGQRAILDISWDGIAKLDLPEQFLLIESAEAPHDWLLPQVRAIVHHGGGGTLAAGLRAGVPSVTIPQLLNQYFGGNLLVDLGVGLPPIPKRELTIDRLATAIQTVVEDQAMRDRAVALGAQIRSENGVKRAVEIIHQHLSAAQDSRKANHETQESEVFLVSNS